MVQLEAVHSSAVALRRSPRLNTYILLYFQRKKTVKAGQEQESLRRGSRSCRWACSRGRSSPGTGRSCEPTTRQRTETVIRVSQTAQRRKREIIQRHIPHKERITHVRLVRDAAVVHELVRAAGIATCPTNQHTKITFPATKMTTHRRNRHRPRS